MLLSALRCRRAEYCDGAQFRASVYVGFVLAVLYDFQAPYAWGTRVRVKSRNAYELVLRNGYGQLSAGN